MWRFLRRKDGFRWLLESGFSGFFLVSSPGGVHKGEGGVRMCSGCILVVSSSPPTGLVPWLFVEFSWIACCVVNGRSLGLGLQEDGGGQGRSGGDGALSVGCRVLAEKEKKESREEKAAVTGGGKEKIKKKKE